MYSRRIRAPLSSLSRADSIDHGRQLEAFGGGGVADDAMGETGVVQDLQARFHARDRGGGVEGSCCERDRLGAVAQVGADGAAGNFTGKVAPNRTEAMSFGSPRRLN